MRESDYDGKLIQAYLDGELDATATIEFEKQIDSDPELKKRVDIERAVLTSMRQKLSRTEAPPWLNKKLEDGIKEMARQESIKRQEGLGFFLGFNWTSALAIGLFIILIGFTSITLHQSLFPPKQPDIVIDPSPSSNMSIMPTTFTYSEKGDVQKLTGNLVCLCEEMHRICPHSKKGDWEELVLKTEDEMIFLILGSPTTKAYIKDSTNLNKQVEITGRVFSTAHVIQTEQIYEL